MKEPLCKYCGKPMIIDRIEYTDIWYKCKCEGYLKEQNLRQELRELEYALQSKKIELASHIGNSLYECSIRELENKIREIKIQYRD